MAHNVFAKDSGALRALSVLESSRPAGWEDLKKSLERRIHQLAEESCVVKDDTSSRWLQGRVQELRELLESFASARSTYESLSAVRGSGAGGF